MSKIRCTECRADSCPSTAFSNTSGTYTRRAFSGLGLRSATLCSIVGCTHHRLLSMYPVNRSMSSDSKKVIVSVVIDWFYWCLLNRWSRATATYFLLCPLHPQGQAQQAAALQDGCLEAPSAIWYRPMPQTTPLLLHSVTCTMLPWCLYLHVQNGWGC